MIPIGTKCIFVGPPEPTMDWTWKTCVVVGHGQAPDDRGDFVIETAHEIEFEDGTDDDCYCYVDESELIPIGHDPDAETRETEREVEA